MTLWSLAMHRSILVALAGTLLGAPPAALAQHDGHDHAPKAPAPQASQPVPSTLMQDPGLAPAELLRRDAAMLLNTVKSSSVIQYLFSTNWLPIIEEPRLVYYNRAAKEAFSPDDFGNFAVERQKGFEAVSLDAKFYYHTRYGSPHAYARPLDLLCAAASPDGKCFKPGQRLLDFGAGGLVHLRLLATMGMHAVGVDVDPLLRAYFRNPEDVGTIAGGDENAPPGILQMEYGSWPADQAIKKSVGSNFDFIISKNTLKKGYIHPAHPVDPAKQISLGVTDEVFVQELFSALKPGGFLIVYNICPAQSAEKYIPWADGKNPFPRTLWEKTGFTIHAFDAEDQEGVKALAKALGWDVGESPMDIEKDLFAWYTIVQRPTAEKNAAPQVAPAKK
jgi:SAM-dependent methyltransferase